jgi:hypothetical protein
VRRYLVEASAIPLKFYAPGRCIPPEGATLDTFLPRYKKTTSIKLVVTGGPGKQSQVWSPFTQCTKPVSLKIKDL